MTTTRIDHTGCSHTATPKARAACRAERNRRIREAQQMFLVLVPGDTPAWDAYNATVDSLSYFLRVPFADAFVIVEDGPVIGA